jgi:hypothetical protein
MRYIKIPKPVELVAAMPGPDGKLPTLDLLGLIRDTLGTQQAWRLDDTAAGLYLDIVEALEQATATKVGDSNVYAKLTDEAHEKLMAVMRAFEPAPMFALPYMRLFKAVSCAPKSVEEPAQEKAANGAVAEA